MYYPGEEYLNILKQVIYRHISYCKMETVYEASRTTFTKAGVKSLWHTDFAPFQVISLIKNRICHKMDILSLVDIMILILVA